MCLRLRVAPAFAAARLPLHLPLILHTCLVCRVESKVWACFAEFAVLYASMTLFAALSDQMRMYACRIGAAIPAFMLLCYAGHSFCLTQLTATVCLLAG
jgi:hypothetical protein